MITELFVDNHEKKEWQQKSQKANGMRKTHNRMLVES